MDTWIAFSLLIALLVFQVVMGALFLAWVKDKFDKWYCRLIYIKVKYRLCRMLFGLALSIWHKYRFVGKVRVA